MKMQVIIRTQTMETETMETETMETETMEMETMEMETMEMETMEMETMEMERNGNNGNGNNGNGNNGNGNNGNGNNGNGNNGNGNTTPATNKTSSTSTLNVSVGEFYSLKLSDTNATILLDSEEKFANGSESTPVTMTIFSSKKYEINAQVSSAEFSGVKEGTSVNTNNIDLKISKVSQNSNINITERQNKSLKYQNAEKIASSLVATKADVYSLVYAIPQENTAAFLDQFGTTISTEITYTLLPL